MGVETEERLNVKFLKNKKNHTSIQPFLISLFGGPFSIQHCSAAEAKEELLRIVDGTHVQETLDIFGHLLG